MASLPRDLRGPRNRVKIYAMALVAVTALAPAASASESPAPLLARGKAPDRVHVLSARTTDTRITIKWEPAATGPRPTRYQFRVVGRSWISTRRTRAVIKRLKPANDYVVKVRALRKRAKGKAVRIHAVTHPSN